VVHSLCRSPRFRPPRHQRTPPQKRRLLRVGTVGGVGPVGQGEGRFAPEATLGDTTNDGGGEMAGY